MTVVRTDTFSVQFFSYKYITSSVELEASKMVQINKFVVKDSALEAVGTSSSNNVLRPQEFRSSFVTRRTVPKIEFLTIH